MAHKSEVTINPLLPTVQCPRSWQFATAQRTQNAGPSEPSPGPCAPCGLAQTNLRQLRECWPSPRSTTYRRCGLVDLARAYPMHCCSKLLSLETTLLLWLGSLRAARSRRRQAKLARPWCPPLQRTSWAWSKLAPACDFHGRSCHSPATALSRWSVQCVS